MRILIREETIIVKVRDPDLQQRHIREGEDTTIAVGKIKEIRPMTTTGIVMMMVIGMVMGVTMAMVMAMGILNQSLHAVQGRAPQLR